MDWTELTCNKLTQLRYLGLDFAASAHSVPERLNNGVLKKLFHRATLYARAVYAVVVCLSVCLSVCHKPVLYRNDWTNRASIWHAGFLPPIPYCVIRKFGLLQKLGHFSLELCPKSGRRKFRHGNSIALSTKLVVVDGRACWRHLYDSRRVVAVYYKSITCNHLTPFDL